MQAIPTVQLEKAVYIPHADTGRDEYDKRGNASSGQGRPEDEIYGMVGRAR